MKIFSQNNNMEIHDITNRIVHLPRDFYKLGNVSIGSLLKQSGYFEVSQKIGEEDIGKALVAYPKCIDEWMVWSEDKRSSGWYFKKNEKGKYRVGYFPLQQDKENNFEYSDARLACAAFIKREIEEYAKLAR
ncbi:MAG: hypothetical protein AAB588_04120 [Patescibacteria group bacterium]